MTNTDQHDPGDEDRRPIYLGPWCENCGDAFDGPERPCPQPSPGRPYYECGRGGHMFRLEIEPPPGSFPVDLLTCPIEIVDAELRAAGVDPDEFVKRCRSQIDAMLAERRSKGLLS